MTTINKILTFVFLIALSSCTTEEPENNVIAVDPNPVEEEPAPVNPVMITYLTVNVDANIDIYLANVCQRGIPSRYQC